jgi:transcriptional regulator with XRE-family HTH domain
MEQLDLVAMGGELRTRRRARGISRTVLAEAIGSRPVIIGRWERGEGVPTPEQAQALIRALALDSGAAVDWEAAALAGALSGGEGRSGGEAARPRGRRWAGGWAAAGSRLWGGRSTGASPDRALSSYLDDPAEQRRYVRRWVLTLAILGALAIALIWAFGELADGWRALVELFRSGPAPGEPAGALHLLGSL